MNWKSIVSRYEAFLRIPQDGSPDVVMRMRAIWVIGMMLVGIQIVNQMIMYVTYDGFTTDHIIGGIAILALLASVHLIRWYKQKYFYAVFFNILLLGAICGTALPQGTGINTALIVFIALGPVMNGFIAGRQAAIAFTVIGFAFVTFLYWVSLNHAPLSVDRGFALEATRYTQSLFALAMSAAMSIMLSEHVYGALAETRTSMLRARRAEAAKSDFLATMSHELRTPLNGVIGLTDALMNANLGPHERELTRTIRRSGESLLLILNDLLDLSKIEAGKFGIEPRAFDITELMEFTADTWRESARAKGLSMDIAITGDVPPAILADDLRIRQILQNLLSNAIKFTATGRVDLILNIATVDGDERVLEFRVSDTGKGIPEHLRDAVFEAFEQGEQGTTRSFGGTGLGLQICRMLATLMGGSIVIEDTSPKGTTFLLTLPAQAADLAPPARASITDATETSIEGLRVLIAEDNEVNRLVIRELIKGWGVESVFVEDGLACLDAVRHQTFDVILMDKHMPGMNGADVARAIRRLKTPMADVPIIAVTADAMAGEREAMLAAGMDDFLAKPVRADALREVIMRTVSRRSVAA
ncbi:ATP-binding protein [Parvularcula sp. LCG005]|uniref:ATP-binding protein n=1 Tax=Parvularcula sp. LCG005 TaxID=3078805 RepID=UPI002942FCC0|nr:ATP-binding protein [Parvularcula sp. LCG005]WOI53847.1 ATP-binding protein [Parvularcula sp. LCG005]